MFSRFMPDAGKDLPSLARDVRPVTEPVINGNGNGNGAAKDTSPAPPAEPNKRIRQDLIDAKVRLHRKLIDDLKLAMLERLSKEDLRRQIADIVGDYVRTERILLNAKELELFTNEVFDELTGLGPIEPLLKDPTV